MNDTEKYLVDLNGYVVLEDAVSEELVVGWNAVLPTPYIDGVVATRDCT